MGDENMEAFHEDYVGEDYSEADDDASSSTEETVSSVPSTVNGDNDDDNARKNASLLDVTTGSLGVLLVALLAIFTSQSGKLYQAYLDLDDSRLHGRGVARIRLFDVSGVANNNDQAKSNFEREVAAFVERNEPFVIRNCIMHTDIKQKTSFWDKDENLIQLLGPDTVLPVRVANRTTNTGINSANHDKTSSATATPTQFRRVVAPGTRGQDSAYLEQNMTLQDFVSSYRSDSNAKLSREHLYVAQVDVMSTLPKLMPRIQDIAPPKVLLDAVGKTPPRSSRPISLYYGEGPLTTQTHYDSLENIVCVVSGGSKLFRLFDPPTASLLLYADRTKYGNGSPVPTDNDDFLSNSANKQFPVAKYALPTIVQLNKGDCLYLPVYWYHSVTTLSKERTISINWWRKPMRNKMVVLEGLFCGTDHFGSSAKCQ